MMDKQILLAQLWTQNANVAYPQAPAGDNNYPQTW